MGEKEGSVTSDLDRILGYVHWEDEPDRRRKVRALCRSCRWVLVQPLVRLVSPNGIAHEQAAHGAPATACGKDASGPGWWWRS